MKRSIRCERVYGAEPPSSDEWRVLVERLWPRGIRKEDLHHDAWHKELAPSTELRHWYAHEVEKWPEFQRRYRAELDANREAVRALLEEGHGALVLLYSARDVEHNSALVLHDYLLGLEP